jgi:hypothetical protein
MEREKKQKDEVDPRPLSKKEAESLLSCELAARDSHADQGETDKSRGDRFGRSSWNINETLALIQGRAYLSRLIGEASIRHEGFGTDGRLSAESRLEESITTRGRRTFVGKG